MKMKEEKNNKQAFSLLNQIIEKADFDDEQHKREMIKQHKSSKTIGMSWMCFHLRVLKDLLTKGE
mgnify:CR=1 FL=1